MRLASISAPWNEAIDNYGTPWQIQLAAPPWRTGEDGAISVQVCPIKAAWNGSLVVNKIPLCASPIPTFTEATRTKEILMLLKFGRDSAWPLKIGAASALNATTSLSVTYDSDRADCDGIIDWVWAKFYEAARADQITVPPAFNRDGITWDFCLRKENNNLHILVRERLADGSLSVIPEAQGLQVMIRYGQNAVIKLRKQTPDTYQILQTFSDCVVALYQGRMQVTEQLQTSEWAMIGSLGNDSLSGVIPRYHRLQAPPEPAAIIAAYHSRIQDASHNTLTKR
jgi:hypothetical protein